MFPLYIIVFLGFIGGKLFNVERQSIASVLFYLIIPIVFFRVALDTTLYPEYLLLPVIFFVICAILCISYLYLSMAIWKDGRANIIAFAAGTGNTGYFGFPLALMLFDEQTVGVYMLGNIGLSIYDYTIGAYVISRGNYSRREAIHKVSRLPMIYAFVFGLILNHFNVKLPCEFDNLSEYMKGTYIVLGMMIIGLGLSSVKKFKIEYKFLAMFLSAKFLAAPLLTLMLIKLDSVYLHIFSAHEFIYKIMILLSIVPPAANTVVFATINRCYPEEAATAVLIGTILAMFYVPSMITLLM
jgi:predicted permease